MSPFTFCSEGKGLGRLFDHDDIHNDNHYVDESYDDDCAVTGRAAQTQRGPL